MSDEGIELICELSPLQQAMLFHTLYAPGSGVYVLQTSLRLTGRLNVSAFERAWRHVIARHGILRSAFFWEGLEKPAQVVFRQTDLEVAHDPCGSLRGLAAEEQREQIARFLEADRERGFELAEAPLMRLALFELAADVRQLVWTQHHLVVDGWSQGQVLRELLATYAAFSNGSNGSQGRGPQLAPARGFGEYIGWLQRQDLGEAEAFWRRSLAGFTAPTFLTDGNRAEPAHREESRRDLALPAATTAALREMARRHRLTLNTLTQGAWALVLAQATGRDEVVFGTTVAGRPADLPGVETIVGPFINTLPVRVEVRPEQRLWKWLAELQKHQVAMRRYEHAPLVDMQKWSELPAGTALFDHILVFENLALPTDLSRPLPGLEVVEEAASALTNYALDVVVLPGRELTLSLRWDAGRLEATAAARMLERLAGVLTAMAAAAAERRIAEIPRLSKVERHQLLHEWNQGGALPAGCLSILPLFERRAALAPDAPALSQGGRRLTYGELDREAGRLALRLRRLGVGPETPVAVLAERSPELIVAFLGILKAGGAYVPLDPQYPVERRASMLADSGALLLGDWQDEKDERDIEDSQDGCSPEAGQLAYVLYTSGSTGRPKGVMVSHGALARYAEAVRPVYGIGPGDRVLQFCSTSFDTSLEEIVACLAGGAELVLRTDAMLASVSVFLESCGAQGITVLSLPTAWWHEIAAKLETEELSLPACLRLVIIGGERALLARVAAWRRRAPDRPRLLNTYGLTESTIVSTVADLAAPSPAEARGEVSIGRGIAGTDLHLLDREMEPVPIDAAGELMIGGSGGGLLARGYLGRPELTAERFVPDPFSGEPGARLYRTGDLARASHDGALEFVGRGDRQIKVRGFRIELEEIEARLLRHPEVESTVVLVREDQPGDKRIVAYVVPRRAPGPPPAALRAFVREELPDHMVPGAWVALDALPLSPNGKLDRRALPAPDSGPDGEEISAAPSDPVEELIAGIWAEVLGRERVGVHDDFFVLGGHSLLATQVVSRLRTVLGAEVPLRQLFEAPTVAELARGLRAARQEGIQTPIQPADRDVRGGDLPLSFAQQRLWLIDQLEPGSTAYNVPSAVRLSGEVSPALLERIFAEIVRRHEALRTRFVSREGRPAQVIARELAPELPVVDLSPLPAAEREARARALAQEEALRPFDLQQGPLLRLALIRISAQEHVLLMNTHHIVSDGWSTGVLVREIAALYSAFAEGRPSPLPELPVQSADFAVWQRGWLRGQALAEMLELWKRRLAGAPRVLELPTDRPRPAVQSYRGALRPFDLPPALAADLRRLCRQEGATLFMALLAAWATLLGRHADQQDLLVGSPVAGRNRREIEDLIGFFVNTLVLRARLSGNPSFRELLGRMRTEALEAFNHQDLPFERLVEELVPERDLGRSPLFQVMLVLQNAPLGALSLPGLTLAPVEAESRTAKFDLTLTLFESGGGGLAGGLEYSTDLFDEARIVRLLQHLGVLLGAAAADPERPIAELPLLTAEERNRVLFEWNDNAVEHPRVAVHEPVEEQVERTPDALAATWWEDGSALTYRELERRANQLAHHLRALGVGPDERVAICLERSLDLPVAVLGVLKAGGAYVPLDPDYPADRVAFMLADSRSRVLVTTSEVAARLPVPGGEGSIPAVLLDADRESIAGQSAEAPVRLAGPEHLAYVIYTSGSTGRPKGVAMPHGVLSNLLMWQRASAAAVPGSRTLQLASLSFDASFHEIFSTWWTGGTMVGIPQELRRDAMALCQVLAGQRITRLFLPFVALQQIAEAIELGAPPPDALLEIVTAGEQLQITRQIAAWLERSRTVLENHYGPSEGHVVSVHRLTGRPATWPALPPIGRPLPNVRMYLLDRSGAPVPQGVPGHLCFGGAQVVRGYLDRPELTAERFIPDPFGGEPGARLYATGDLARFLSDGSLQFLGRIDQQVKIRGFRVEPGEVESALTRHPAVGKAAVVVRGEGPGKRLVGYYVTPDTAVEAAELRAFLLSQLPEHMVPALLVRLDALPLTPSGKLDRKALPVPRVALEGGEDASPEAPSDPIEELLVGIWAEVLGRERIGLHDNFFSLGGHSLLVMQVVSRIRAVLGAEVRPRQIFEAPTVAELARIVQEARETRQAKAQSAIRRVDRELWGDDLPLSFAQQRLWLIDQLAPGNLAYNIPVAVRLTGGVSLALLERIFAEIIRRHEALRTTFDARGGRPVQVIRADFVLQLPVVDLSGLRDRTDLQVREIALAEALRPFDLRRGPLLRLTLVRLGEAEHVLLVTLHHIVSDGWSMGVLVREIAALHAAFSQGQPSPLPELPVQYADFAVWQRSWLSGDELAAQLASWKRRLAGAPTVLELPTDRPRPAVQTFNGSSRSMDLPPALSAALRTLCRHQGATPFMVLLAAWGALMGRHAGQDDLLVGSPIAGRNHREIEDLIGFFVNTLVLRIRLDNTTFRELLGRVRGEALEAFGHQDLPFERLVEELVPERNLAVPPLFQVVFALQNAPLGHLALPGLALSPVTVESRVAKVDLSLSLIEVAGVFSGTLEHNTDLFDQSTAARLLARFEVLLEAVAGDPDLPPADLPLLHAAERHQVLLEWNDNAKPCPQVPMVHELVALHARRRPEAVAVDGVAGRLTYGELEARANRLARHLRRLGVGPEVLVALCTERTPERVVGILAVLAAGGAYVSLDPAHPPERLAFLLDDARAPVVLTQSRFLDALPASGARVICLDTGWPEIEGEESSAPETGVGPDNLAYVVYTSGSTGRPKGVEIPHAGLMNLVRWHQDLYRVTPEDRATQIASPAFDASIWELWPYLAAGASVHIPDEETRLSSSGMIRWWSEQGITLAYLMTPLAEGLLEEKVPPGVDLDVRALIIGGDRLHRGPDPEDPGITFRLMNHYGPAEYSVVSTVVEVPPRGEAAATPTIGRPVDNTRIYLLDRHLAPVPIGVPGELCVAGLGTARGYLRRPELTAEKFVPDPWSAEPGARIYRTADLVRFLPDGDMDFLGRIDHQVKIRGLRIELGEIEAVLGQHPRLREAVVLAREDRPGQKRLVAYAVLNPTDPADPTDRSDPTDALPAFLREKLPDYMLPTAFVILDALPLTSNGKVDRRALPAPQEAAAEGATYVAPRDPMEELLAGLWAEVLRVDRVGVHDDFFALGGHSLLATQVMSRLRQALGADLPLRALFKSPTVSALAEEARAARREGAAPATPIVPAARTEPLPLSFAQQRLWLIDQLEPGNPAYNIPSAVRLSGHLSAALLERVFAEVVRRHEALRTTFEARDGRPVQVIRTDFALELPVVDLSGLRDRSDRSDLHTRQIAREEARRPFDLERGPLLRLTLIRLAGREHVLLMNVHHIVSDGWSMGVLLREVAALHEAYASGRPSPLPELPVQYADFAVWQRDWLSGGALEAQLAAWKRRLAGAPQVLDLPTDRPRPAVQTSQGATRSIDLPPALSAAVRTLCQGKGVTPFMALLAVWAAMLGRHAGQDDVLVGSPIAGRNRREIEDVIGFFVNTLVLRGVLSGNPTFRELLQGIRGEALEAFSHQDLPFERLVEELVPERDLSRSPLFQVLFAVQNAPATALNVPGLTLAPVPVENGLAKFDLTLALWEGPSGWSGALEYNTDLFDGTTAERFLRHFASLLASAAEDPGRPLSELRLMDAAEERLLTTDLNDLGGTERVWAAPVAVHDLFALQAGQTPDRIAAVGPLGAITYREMDERSTALAARIGSGALDRRIALLADPDPQVLLGMLGILEAGCSFVPLDPRHPDERLAWMLEDCGCEVLITQRRHRERAEGLAGPCRILCLEDAHPSGEPTALRELRSLAYVVYTSGSTGRPKGVQVAHESLVPMLLWGCEYLGLGVHTRVLQSLSFCFDFGIFEHLTTVLAGGTLVFPGEAAGDPEAFAREIVRHGIDTLHTTPAFARELAAQGEVLDSLAVVHLGGEALSRGTVERIREAAPGATVYNGYGPTEATVNSSIFRLESSLDVPQTIPIGRRSADNALYILDPAGRLSLLGARGELHVGGIGVARGYLNRQELTAERFVPDPFGRAPGGRLYKTGDLVRYLPGGDVEFLGRIDHQVKVRGFRIELGEVEAALRAHPEVRDCVVVARDNALVAYTVGGPGATDLRSFLGDRLPVYMVPSIFVPLPALPLTPNGKIDRKALPAPQEVRPAGDGYVAPRDPVEELLAGLWMQVLRRDQVGVHDDFFALGGHSLLATQVMSRLRQVLGMELPLRALFEAPTVGALAEVVRAARREDTAPAPPLVPAPRSGPPPLSFAQQRLWLIDQLDPGNPAYNMPTAVRLSGELSVDLLERIFAEVVRRHEALRTTFDPRAGEPVQVIAPSLRPELPVVDLSNLPEIEREARALVLAREEAGRPFDLRSGPLLRLTLLRLAGREHVLLMNVHHIVSDGWSMGVLLREIAVLHEAFAAGRPSPLPELPVQYADFAVWQREWLSGEVLEAQLASWKRRLAGAPHVLDLPTDRPRPAVQTYNGGSRAMDLPPDLSTALRALCRSAGVTPFMAMLAAWSMLLGRHAGQDDVLVGTSIAGRNRREIEDLIGFFVNTLVLREDLSGNPSFRELLGRVRGVALEAFSHQDLPFERLVEELVPERDLSRSPLFQAFFVLQNAPVTALSVPGLTLAPLAVDDRLAKFDLTLAVGEDPSGWSAGLEYNSDLFDGTTAERLLGHFVNLLASAAGDPGQPLDELRLMDAAEERLLTTDLNRTEHTWALPVAVHDLFARQAGRTPDKIAAAGPHGAVTYREIAERSAALAILIQRAAAGALDRRIALLADPDPQVLIGMLGILQAGGGFVPLDPRHPDERLAWILEDSGCDVLVTQRRHRERAEELAAGLRHILCLEDVLPSGVPSEAQPARDLAELLSLAYVVYTSGSTGTPKGVQVSHGSLATMLLWGCGYLGLGAHTRVLQSLSFCFDFGIFEHLTTVLAGGTLVFPGEAPGEAAGDPQAFAREIVRHGIDTLHTTPAFARELPAAGESLDSLRIVHLGGEALPPSTVERVRETAPRATVYNGYGPTETTINSSIFCCGDDVGPVVAIGRRSADNALYVLDSAGRLSPFGARGELHVGGIGVARGYLNRPELTAERFVPDPFGAAPGGRLYKTGDLVRYLPAGDIEFLGRIDHQVKVRGFRIELGEIETVLRAHPGVRDCVVVARENVLVAYVVLHRTDPTDRTDPSDPRTTLTAFLRERLPDYMVPSVFMVLPALPLTPNGKVDRRALPEPERAAGPGRLGPRDALELALAELFEEVLGVHPVGVRDDFFALGGHSLLAARLMFSLRRRLGRSLPLASLLRHPTVERLAAHLREDAEPLPRTPLVELAPESPGPGRPLFLVHPVGGEVLCYVPLARRLAAGHAVYGLQASEESLTLEAMADLYLRHVRAVQPQGPYLLGGWSLGGAVAFEMARRLESRGETVERVILIDSVAPGSLWQASLDEGALVAAFANDLARLLRLGGVAFPEDLGQVPAAEALAWLAARGEEIGFLPPGSGAADLERRFATFAANHRAMALYRGGPCSAPLLLLRAAATPGAPDLGWERVAGEPVEVHELPGDHYTLLQEPQVARVVEILGQPVDVREKDVVFGH